jgi:hypothetical protein
MKGKTWGYDDTLADLEEQGRQTGIKEGEAREQARILKALRAEKSYYQAKYREADPDTSRDYWRGAVQALQSTIEGLGKS